MRHDFEFDEGAFQEYEKALRDLYDNPVVLMNWTFKSHIIMHHMHDFMERTGENFAKTPAEAIES